MNIADLTSESIRSIQAYKPGKPLEALAREYGITDAIKLASNENPLGASPLALAAIKKAMGELHRYPDGDALLLKNALAAHLSVKTDRIVLGNGSNEILDLIVRTFVSPDHEVIFSQHAFLVYPIVTKLVGATSRVAKAYSADAATPYGHNLAEFSKLINAKTRLIFIANPNNPTGTWLAENELKSFIRSLPAHIIVVVDEAYFEFVQEKNYPNTALWIDEFPNLLVTRTFSKIYGLAALRVGYGITSPEISDLLNRVRQPFNTNTLGQVAAIAALQDKEFVQQAIEINQEGLAYFYKTCKEMGLNTIPSVGNFLLIEVGKQSDAVYEGLLREGVIVRPVANYGLSQFLRVTVGNKTENQRCMTALKKVMQAQHGA